MTDATCGDACWAARSDVCRCSCDGKNHGITRTADGERPTRTPGDRPPKARPRRKGQQDSIFERVKAAITVEELAGRYTQLTQTGPGKLKALCPIHDEKTPSFHVDQERQTWHCFGACATGGDVITLAQELMNRGKL